MSLAKASIWTAISVFIKIACGLLVVKLLAIQYGPSGLGLAGNFRQLITVLGVLSGAGIFNGVTKYVAQYQSQPAYLCRITGTATMLVMLFSLLLAVVFMLASGPISIGLFGLDRYQHVIQGVALLQMGIAWANLSLAIIKGLRDAFGNALALIVGSMLGVAAYFLCWRFAGYSGALLGLALAPAAVAIPAFWLLLKRHALPLHWLWPVWDAALVRQLAKFTVMALITSATLPIAWMIMRNMLAANYGWDQVGIWQGVTTISDAWLQFITATFSVWLLPTLSKLHSKKEIARQILHTLRFVMPLAATVSLGVWLLRDVAIWLLFSGKFSDMRTLFVWQLIGDVLKVSAYVFGYLVIAKASLRFYLLTEISQFVLLMVFSHWLIPRDGAMGAAQAYMATYLVYFTLCCGVFYLYYRRQ